MLHEPSHPAPDRGSEPTDPVVIDERGPWVPDGGFHVDPWLAVELAVITHAHADHVVRGCGSYLCTPETARILKVRLGPSIRVQPVPLGASIGLGETRVSLHPAGHVLGSAQVRIDAPRRGGRGREVWVISGDYATVPNPTCTPFEPVRCDVFVSECTFGLPIYRWPDPAEVAAEINAWWAANAADGRNSVIFAYALGKAQRVLAGLDASIGPVLEHGAMRAITETFRDCGVSLPDTRHAVAEEIRAAAVRALLIAPPSAAGSPWMRRLEPVATAFASGWMRLRGTRRRRNADRGFVLSDHADDPGLMEAIAATGAERIGLTHGQVAVMARRLQERGHRTLIHPTRYEAGPDADADAAVDAAVDATVDAAAMAHERSESPEP